MQIGILELSFCLTFIINTQLNFRFNVNLVVKLNRILKNYCLLPSTIALLTNWCTLTMLSIWKP